MSKTNEFLGTNNKYNRPIPYVWLIMLAVSLLPTILFMTITDTIQCDESILKDRTAEEYEKQKGMTISEAIEICASISETGRIIAYIGGGIFFITLTITLKPWPLSDLNENDEPERRTPV